MPDADRKSYERYLYNKVSEEDTIETAREDGWFEGFDEGRADTLAEIAKKMKTAGINSETILQLTGISEKNQP